MKEYTVNCSMHGKQKTSEVGFCPVCDDYVLNQSDQIDIAISRMVDNQFCKNAVMAVFKSSNFGFSYAMQMATEWRDKY